MHLIETKISDTTIHMRYADDPDPVKATEWMDFQAKIDRLTFPRQSTLKDQYLVEIRLAALRHAREVIIGEIRALEHQ